MHCFGHRIGYGTDMRRDTNQERARVNRARRAAERQGLRLEKCRRRDPRAIGYGLFHLGKAGAPASATSYTLTIDDVEKALGEPTARKATP